MTDEIESTFHIFYRVSDGEIFGWGDSPWVTAIDGLEYFHVDRFNPDPLTQKVDTVAMAVVEKSAEEKCQARLPTLIQIQHAVYQELCRTDSYAIADRPMATDVRAAWGAYRQMLRDLSKLAGPVEMVQTWTLPPDGHDPMTKFR